MIRLSLDCAAGGVFCAGFVEFVGGINAVRAVCEADELDDEEGVLGLYFE
jgi:hypothetical protein